MSIPVKDYWGRVIPPFPPNWPRPYADWNKISDSVKEAMEGYVIFWQGATCHYCDRFIYHRWTMREYPEIIPDYIESGVVRGVLDHKIPRIEGGTNEYENLVIACCRCNSRKRDKNYFDFLLELEAEELAEAQR